MSNTLIGILKQHAASTPDSIFISHLESGTNLTYQQTFEFALKLATLFDRLNIGRKDRVVLAARNHWIVYPLLIACSLREATLVPIDPELHREELSSILKHASPVLTISTEGITLPNPIDPLESVRMTLTEVIEAVHSIGLAQEIIQGEAEETVLIIYTSGTTGNAKAVKLSERNLISNATSLVGRYEVSREDRFFCILPTHHMNALMITGMVPLVAGAQIYLSDILSFKNAKLFWKNLTEHQITICSLVPSIMALLLKLFPQGADSSLRTLRYGFCGAAPLAESTWLSFEEVFGFPIYQGYGLTETSCWATSTPLGPHRRDCVGTPLDCEVKIDDPPSSEVESYLFKPNGSSPAGEILIRGAIVTSGYFRNQKLTSETITEDGFFKTGDLGFFDSEGQLNICGRLKDIIIKNGSNVFPRDIEQELCRHPAVRECKTFGIPDELVGERIYSVCVLKEDYTVTELELRTWLQARISKHLYPDAVRIYGYLPSGSTGKISSGLLRKISTGELSDEIVTSLQSRQIMRSPVSAPSAVQQIIQQSLVSGTPIQFLAYWGCGKRGSISDVDRLTLMRLVELTDRVRRVRQVVPKLTLIFTDMHARNNQIPEVRQCSYFNDIAEFAQALGLQTEYLSEIWSAAGLTVSQIMEKKTEPAFESDWLKMPFREQLINQAKKHLEQGGNPEDAAKFYYLCCRSEAPLISRRYHQAIFTTYNPPHFDFLLPDLPKLYLYSYKHGTSVKPWFVEEVASSEDFLGRGLQKAL